MYDAAAAAVFMIIRKRISASEYPQVMIRQGRMPCAFPILMAIMFRRKGEAEKQRAPIKIVTVHALSRACTSNVAKIAFQQSEALSALCARFSPFNSVFSRKAREKHLAFQVGLYSS